MIILAIDPGTTVGYSVYNTEKDTIDYNQVPNQVFPQILHCSILSPIKLIPNFQDPL